MTDRMHPDRERDIARWKLTKDNAVPCGCNNTGYYVCQNKPCITWPTGTKHTHGCTGWKCGGEIRYKQWQFERGNHV